MDTADCGRNVLCCVSVSRIFMFCFLTSAEVHFEYATRRFQCYYHECELHSKLSAVVMRLCAVQACSAVLVVFPSVLFCRCISSALHFSRLHFATFCNEHMI